MVDTTARDGELPISLQMICKTPHGMTHEPGEADAELVDVPCKSFVVDVHLTETAKGIRRVTSHGIQEIVPFSDASLGFV